MSTQPCLAFHVALSDVRDSVQRHGLQPGPPGDDGQPSGVYLWLSLAEAEMMGLELDGVDSEELDIWQVDFDGFKLLEDPWIASARYSPRAIQSNRLTLLHLGRIPT
jgi:hypothetical protein